MRRRAAWAALPLLSLVLAGCASPFTPYSTFAGGEVTAHITVKPYDSDGNNLTDGVALTLLTSSPPPLVGSDVLVTRNGDTNVTVWRCPQREARLCDSFKGVPSWDAGETIYVRGLPGIDRLNIQVRERFVYNTTVRVDEDRDTEVWAAINAQAYDSNGNGTADGIQLFLVNSDKAPFASSDVRVDVNKVQQTTFTDPGRLAPFAGQWRTGTAIFVKGFIGQNHVEVTLKATRYDLGTYVVGE